MSDFFCDFWRYLPTYVLYTMYYLSMYYVRFSTYLPTQKSDILYGRSPMWLFNNYFDKIRWGWSTPLFKYIAIAVNFWTMHSVQEKFVIQFYCPGLISLFLIHTSWGQHKYVRKFEMSREIFEKTQNLSIMKKLQWIMYNKHAKKNWF